MGVENMLAGGYSPTPIEPYGNALMRAQQLRSMQQANALQQMQAQDMHAQRAQALLQAQQQQADRARMQAWQQSIPSPQMAASQQALGGGGGPTMGNAQRMQPVDPRLQLLHGQMLAGGDPTTYINAAYPKPDLMTVAEGASVFDKNKPGAGAVFSGTPKTAAEDAFVRLLRQSGIDPASSQGQKLIQDRLAKESTHAPASSMYNFGSPVAGQVGGKPAFFATDKTGQVKVLEGVAPPAKSAEDKPLTEGQAKALAFSSRMESADKVLTDLSSKGLNKTIPGGMGNNMVGSAITSMAPQDQQRLMQAKRNFINAVLRRESGAVIAADEFANAERQYFPQIGEGADVIAQKARERRVAIEGMRADVPKGQQGEVDRIAGVGAGPKPTVSNW